MPCEAGCWVRSNLGAPCRNYSSAGWARSRAWPRARCATPAQPAVSLLPCPSGAGPCGAAPAPRCLPPSAGRRTPAPGCRSSAVCGLSAEAAQLTASRVCCRLFHSALGEMRYFAPKVFSCSVLVATASSGEKGLAFPLLCSEAQSSVQAPADLAAPCPSVQCHGHSAKHPLTLAALCCVDVPPCSSYHTPCWSTQFF